MDTTWQAAYRVRAGRQRKLLVVCDHASNAIPAELGDLGLDAIDRQRHIAWDPGAAAVAERLAQRFDADAVFSGTSRLVVDANRAPESGDLILAQSDGIFVPGNEGISHAERERRLERYHAPYHQAIDDTLTPRLAAGEQPLLLSIHSFEPVLADRAREWSIGVMWKLDREPVAALIEALAVEGHSVGDNQPYDGRVAIGYTLEHHAIRRGLPHVLIELRNNEVADNAQQDYWAEQIGRALVDTGFL